jgi:Phage tail lysozyme
LTAVPQVQITARDYLLSKGAPPIALNGAIAGVAVLYYESKLDPGSQGFQATERGGVLNPHGAYGIASLNGPRQGDLLAFATKYDLPVDALETQLAFFLTEIANSYPASWSAIRSSASIAAIIETLVNEYENPKNKQAEIDGALTIAEALASLPPPVAAPAPAPDSPTVPTAPTPVPVPPAQQPAPAPGGKVPAVPAASAGRLAAALDMLYEVHEARVQELVSADSELASVAAGIAAIRAFMDSNNAPPALLPPAAGSTATTTQGTIPMLGKNWITSVFGVGSIAGAVATLGVDLYNKDTTHLTADFGLILAALSGGGGLIQAKDKNVTGGTVPQTIEATARAGSPPIK